MQHANDSANTRARTTATTTEADNHPTPQHSQPDSPQVLFPAHSKEAAAARNDFVGEIIGGFCQMNDNQRKALASALLKKREKHQRSENEMKVLCKDASPETMQKLIRLAKAMLNDDLAELKAIKAEAPENWSASLDETITDLEQGKRAMQPDLSIPKGITLEERKRLLIAKVDTLRPAEIIAALNMIEMTGVKL